jgi:hypothetical protein
MPLNHPDLTQHPPRSPRVQLGAYVIFPRLLDKCRATLAGKQGEYKYACPLDQRWFDFVGIDPAALQQEAAAGKSDAELLAWVMANGKNKRTSAEIAAWSAFQDRRAPSDVESRQFYQEIHNKLAPHREDVTTWFDLLDLDDYASFGGKP